MTKFKEYKRKEFEEWCEDNGMDYSDFQFIWDAIKEQPAILDIEVDDKDETKGALVVRFKIILD